MTVLLVYIEFIDSAINIAESLIYIKLTDSAMLFIFYASIVQNYSLNYIKYNCLPL